MTGNKGFLQTGTARNGYILRLKELGKRLEETSLRVLGQKAVPLLAFELDGVMVVDSPDKKDFPITPEMLTDVFKDSPYILWVDT